MCCMHWKNNNNFFLRDYELPIEIVDVVYIDQYVESETIEQAMDSPLCKEWSHTMKEELDFLKDHSIWKCSFLPNRKKVLRT